MKFINKVILLLILSGAGCGNLYAQYGLGLLGFEDVAASQQFNPANIGTFEFGRFRISVDAGAWLSNSHLAPAGIVGDSANYITHETRNDMIAKLGNGFVAGGGYSMNLATVNVRMKGLVWGFYLNQSNLLSGGFNNPNTAGLVLLGNGPYANQTVSDENIYFRNFNTRELAAGTAYTSGDFTIGGRVKLIQGLSMIDANIDDFSLFTDSIGTRIDLQADYDIFSTYNTGKKSPFRTQGFGGGIDLGFRYNLGEKMELHGSILDLGVVSWKTKEYKNNVDISWEGIELSSLFATDIPEQIEGQVDSLRDLLLPDSIDGSHLMMTPVRLAFGMNYDFSEKSMLCINAVFSPLRTGAKTKIPLLSVGYFRQLLPGFRIGVSAYGGGTELFGFGLSGIYRIDLGVSSIDIMACSDNLLGFIPGVGRAMNARAALGFNF